MWRKIVVLGLMGMLFSGCQKADKTGVEIITKPTAKVFINGKEAGSTPYKNDNLKAGQAEIRLVSEDREMLPWQQKVNLESYTYTVIDLQFSKDDVAGGYLLKLEPSEDKSKAGLIVGTFPDRASLTLDGVLVGFSPVNIPAITPGDHHVEIAMSGYKPIEAFVKAIPGYRLILQGQLSHDYSERSEPVSKEEVLVAEVKTVMIRIKKTETGFLRVRAESNTNSKELKKVIPGEIFEKVSESNEWTEVKLKDETTGWILSRYTELAK